MSKCWRFAVSLSATALCLVSISSAPGSETVGYTYDALGRLTQVSRSGTINNGTQTGYAYDSAGNRTSTNVTTPGTVCAGIGFSVNDVAVYEGTPLAFIVTKSGSTTSSCSINFATANGTAVSPNDYGTASGTLTFTAGQTSQSVSISTVIAGPNEPTEYMYLNLSGSTGGAAITDNQGKGTIYNYFDGCITCTQSAPPPPVE
jgi:YD repeat-containing protein